MVKVLRHAGARAWKREVLQMSVRTLVGSCAQSFRIHHGMLSGSAALRGLILSRDFLISSPATRSGNSLGGRVSQMLGEVLKAVHKSCSGHPGQMDPGGTLPTFLLY